MATSMGQFGIVYNRLYIIHVSNWLSQILHIETGEYQLNILNKNWVFKPHVEDNKIPYRVLPN